MRKKKVSAARVERNFRVDTTPLLNFRRLIDFCIGIEKPTELTSQSKDHRHQPTRGCNRLMIVAKGILPNGENSLEITGGILLATRASPKIHSSQFWFCVQPSSTAQPLASLAGHTTHSLFMAYFDVFLLFSLRSSAASAAPPPFSAFVSSSCRVTGSGFSFFTPPVNASLRVPGPVPP
jgi:hypothetical protein